MDNLYTKEDKELILSLFKVAAPSQGQVMQVYELYRKYINSNQPYSTGGCGNCLSGYSNIFRALRDWMSENINKFEDG